MRVELSDGILWVSGASFEQSQWLGQNGFWFYGSKSSATVAKKMTARAIPANTRYIELENVAKVAQLLGAEGLEWTSEARDVVAPRVETMRQAHADSWATDAEIAIPAPSGLEYRGYQRAGVSFALSAFARGQKGVIIGDEMGLGKTMQAIGVMAITQPESTLIVCPSSLRMNWMAEISKWIPALAGSIHLVNGGEVVPEGAKVVIVNYDKVVGKSENATKVRDGLNIDWDLVVFDEAHVLKNEKAARTQFFLGVHKRGAKSEAGLIERAAKRLMLTGTPIQNRVRESLCLLRAAGAFGPGAAFADEGKFLFRHCGPSRGTHGWSFDGSTNLEELGDKLRSGGIMIRRLKRDVAKELPPKIRSVIALPYSGGLRVPPMEGEFEAVVERLEREKVGFSEISRMRAQLAEEKKGAVIEHLVDVLENESKVIVFAHHSNLLDAISAKFDDGKGSAIRIDGEVSPDKRQGLVDQFQTDPKCRIAILSTHAAGVGLTLTAASSVVFAEADWNPSWCLQAEDRAHRISQTASSVDVAYLVLDGTLDAHVIKTMVAKMDIADRVLDSNAPSAEAPAAKPISAPPAPVAPVVPAVRTVQIQSPKMAVPFEVVMTDEKRAAIMEAFCHIAGSCDGAHAQDGIGFTGLDASSAFVQSLVAAAQAGSMTDRQAAWGVVVLQTYSKTQIAHLWARIQG
jgi:SWI/SNF-related matrix-associated actin-dependent regulator 1 of chromatin subfamily A